ASHANYFWISVWLSTENRRRRAGWELYGLYNKAQGSCEDLSRKIMIAVIVRILSSGLFLIVVRTRRPERERSDLCHAPHKAAIRIACG
ncbi:hypothetical protein, partial [Brenneria salicis]|uniref:hypothetical protein n=1 Tax=Brenneria salicis TaxID=55214 RepID=UPI001B7D60E2